MTLRSSADIIARVTALEESLQWRDSLNKPGAEWQLLSRDTQRMIARVRSDATDGTFCSSFWSYEREHDSFIFATLDAAKQFAKFSAVKSVLEDDLRRASIQ